MQKNNLIVESSIAAWEKKNSNDAMEILLSTCAGHISLEDVSRRQCLYWSSMCVSKWGSLEQQQEMVGSISPSEIWPINEIFGHQEYKLGNIAGAYERFRVGDTKGIKPTDFPTWSMGVSAYHAIGSETAQPMFRHFSGRNSGGVGILFVVGLDEGYLPFCQVLAKTLKQHNDCHLAVLLHTTTPDDLVEQKLTTIYNAIGADRVSIYLDNTDISTLSKRNKKGYYTLLRYFLAYQLSLSSDFSKIIVPDVDLVVKSKNFLQDIKSMTSDVGLLMVGRWPRPWLRFTAPMIIMSGAGAAQKFLKSIVDISSETANRAMLDNNVFLWGVDQAAIQMSFDENRGLSYQNSIPFFRENVMLAQEFGSKEGMLSFGD